MWRIKPVLKHIRFSYQTKLPLDKFESYLMPIFDPSETCEAIFMENLVLLHICCFKFVLKAWKGLDGKYQGKLSREAAWYLLFTYILAVVAKVFFWWGDWIVGYLSSILVTRVLSCLVASGATGWFSFMAPFCRWPHLPRGCRVITRRRLNVNHQLVYKCCFTRCYYILSSVLLVANQTYCKMWQSSKIEPEL